MSLIPFSLALGVLSNDPSEQATNYKTSTPVTIKQNVSGTPLASIYLDEDGTTPLPNPMNTDTRGIAAFYIEAGEYIAEYQDNLQLVTSRFSVSTGVLQKLGGLTERSDLAQRSRFETTVAKIALGGFASGDKLTVTDRAGAHFNVVSGGTANGYDVIDAGSGKTAVLCVDDYESLNPEFFGASESSTDITTTLQYIVASVGANDPFAANQAGVTILFDSRKSYNVLGTVLLPSYVRIDLNQSNLTGTNSTVMFETGYFNGSGVLVSNTSEAVETRFVLNTHVVNGRISNSLGFNLYNYCESSTVENIRFFGCNKAVSARRCFYGSFQKLHSRSPVNPAAYACFTFDSAMGALDADQLFAVGYDKGYSVIGNKDNMQVNNFGAEACPVGFRVDNTTSGISLNRGYFENNFTSISFSSDSNHENVVVDNCWFHGTTNAFEALTVLSGTWRENNILNGAAVSLQNDFSCRMTVEIPTDVTANNAVYALPSNYLIGRANNVKYIKQIYDSTSGLVEAKCDVYAGPIPRNYAGTSGKPIQDQIPFCVSALTSTTLTIDTKIVYQNPEFVGVQLSVNGTICGGIALAGQMMSTITSSLTITPSNNGGFYRFVVSGFTGGTTFSGVIKIL